MWHLSSLRISSYLGCFFPRSSSPFFLHPLLSKALGFPWSNLCLRAQHFLPFVLISLLLSHRSLEKTPHRYFFLDTLREQGGTASRFQISRRWFLVNRIQNEYCCPCTDNFRRSGASAASRGIALPLQDRGYTVLWLKVQTLQALAWVESWLLHLWAEWTWDSVFLSIK